MASHDGKVTSNAGELVSRENRVRGSSANADHPQIVSIRVRSFDRRAVLSESLPFLPFPVVLPEVGLQLLVRPVVLDVPSQVLKPAAVPIPFELAGGAILQTVPFRARSRVRSRGVEQLAARRRVAGHNVD